MRRLIPVLVVFVFTCAGQAPPPANVTVRIDPNAPGKPFPHFWEQMFGSGRANLSLRDSYRRDVRAVKQITDFKYIRFHAVLDDENGVYSEDKNGKPVYNWTYVDQIYDGLLDNGVKPFVELSFMPRALTSRTTPHAFWYHPFVAPPADYAKWGQLVEDFTRHLIARYGREEVATWYFEVWNEPNIDFWTGEPKFETYTRLYTEAARAVKRVDAGLRVGGPATAQAAWIDKFIEFAVSKGVPVDFVSTHAYANDTSKDIFGTDEVISRRDMLTRAVHKVYDQVKRSPRPNLPIIWSEFNATYLSEVNVTDSPFMGPWLANLIRNCDGLTSMMSYWSFSDVFEEQGVARTPFYGGYGLVAVGNIPKPAFNDFRLLHQLGNQRLPDPADSVLATRRADGSLAIALWNYAEPGQGGAPRTFNLEFAGAAPKMTMSIVDREHGSSLTKWEAMGRPDFPSRRQQEDLRNAAQLPRPVPLTSKSITLPVHALALIQTQP